MNNYRLIAIFLLLFLSRPNSFAQTYNIATLNGQTINTCSGSFTDSNGSGSYSNNENYTITFCSSSGLPLMFDFSDPISNPPFYDIDVAGDSLFVYNGTSATGTPIAILTYLDDNTQTTYSSQLQIATNSTCVTFKWKSNASGVDAGWNASISCVSPPTCSGNPPAADIFGQATPICNLNNYCGSTATYYGEDTPYNLIGGGTCPATDDGIFGGTIENNSWLSFQANTTTASFIFTVSNCGGGGVQVGIFGFSNNTFSLVSPCATTDGSQGGTFTVNATGLTPGNTYYIMIDGNSGANCDYTIHANTGVATVNAGPDQTVCSTSATLAANTPLTGTGTWTVVSGTGTFANPNSPTSTVSGLSNGANVFQWTIPSGLCANVSDNVTITVSGAVAAAAAGNDITQCNTNSFTMAANSPAAGSTGAWSIVSGTVAPASSTSPTQTFTLTGTSATLQWSITTPGCGTTTDNIIITNNTGTPPTTGFSYSTPICANGSNPSPITVAGFTTGGTYSSTAGLSINAATGIINLGASTPATYTVTYSIAASGCSTAGSSTASIVITPTTTPTTGFSYSTPVCTNATNPSPTTVAGFTTGGTYSSAAGLSINATTGVINLAASTPATYTVTYSVAAAGCSAAGSGTTSIAITPTTTPTTGFSYTSPVCLNAGTNPTPTTVAGFTTGGTYSSTAGLTINAATGAITLASSSAGTYTVTYSVAASGCRTAGTNTATITLTAGGAPTTGFSYTTPVCANATNPSPTNVAGFTAGGTYSSTAGLSINASTGAINLAASTPSTYTVTYSVAASGCSTAGSSTTAIAITPTTTPTTGFSYTSPVCLNAGTTPTPTPVAGFATGGTYSSTAGLTINAATGAITLSSSSAGTYTVTYSVAASGCQTAGTNTASITLTNGGAPTTGFSYTTPVCANAANPSPTTVAGFTIGGTYTSTAGLSINPANGAINLAASTPSTYTVTYSVAASGCSIAGSSTASIVITPTTTPTTGFSYTSPVCLNAGTTPTPTTVAGFTTGGTYSSTAGLTINAATGDITLGSSSAGTYTVTYSVAASGCQIASTNTASISLTNGGTPTTSFSYISPVCANATNPSPTAVAGFTAGGTYSSAAGLSINAATGTINLSASTPSTYTVTYSVAASGCSTAGSSTASIVITPTTTPTTGFSYISPVCLNAGTSPTPTTVAGFTTGGTYSSTAGLTINASTGDINLSTSSAGTYTVTYSIAASGCQIASTNTTSITLTNGGAPSTSFSYISPVCANATNPSPTTVAGFTTGGTYSSTAGLIITATTGVINLAASTPSTYTVTYSVAASGCSTAGSSTASIVITPTTTPTTGFSYASPICLNAGATPTPTTVVGFTTGGTYSSSAGLTINATTGAVTLASSSAGTYTVSYSVAASGCQVAGTNTASVTLTAGGTATTGFSYPPTICTNAASTLPTNVVGFVTGGTYISSPAGLSINSNTGLITPNTSSPSTYTITYSVNASGCTSAGTSTTSVTINTNPNSPTIQQIDSVCIGSNNSITILNPIQGLTYNWNLLGGNITSGIGTATINSTWTGSGLGTISVSASNNCGTSPVSTKNVIIVNATINPPNVITICQGQSANINVSGNANAYIWSPSQGLSNPNITNPIATPSVTTQYIVSTVGTCAIKDTILIKVLPIPAPSFTIEPQTTYVNSQINFMNTTGQANYTYEWNLDNGLGIVNQYNTSYIYQDTGNYTITLTAINILGCKDSTKQLLHIKEEPTFYVPNTFTPNGDNYNQIFQPLFVGYTRIEGYIYNRWGEKIYQWNELNGGWDGTIKGRPALQDTYIYVIKMYNETNEYNPVIEKSGHLNLIR